MDVEIDWTEKGKHRSCNTVAPLPGGGAAEVAAEISQIGKDTEEETAAAGHGSVNNHIKAVPSLTCEPAVAQEALAV